MKKHACRAYGKINLFLDIVGRREDGYHLLETVFQSISLGDEVMISPGRGGEISLRSNLPYIPTDRRNIAYKAAEAFFAAANMPNKGLYINMRKNIPVGAGLGGSSTDGAAVLRLLNAACGEPLPEERLREIAAELGADCPFCLMGGAALGGGVGDRLEPLPSMPPCTLVICKPAFSVSAKSAYELYDAAPSVRAERGAEDMEAALRSGSLSEICAGMFNALEAVVAGKYPEIAEIKRELLRLGALGAMMTGSGSAVYGVFEKEDAAKEAAEALKQEKRRVYLAQPQTRD